MRDNPKSTEIKDAVVRTVKSKLPTEAMISASSSWSKATPYENKSAVRGNTRQAGLSLEPLQEWEGYVIAIGVTTFTARLVDKTRSSEFEEEITDFPLEEIRDDDLPLLAEGAVFRWVIGYQRQASGTKIRASQIVFRRMPAWGKAELKKARIEAKQMISEIHWG